MKKIVHFLVIIFVSNTAIFSQKNDTDTLVVQGVNRENLYEYLSFWIDTTKTANIEKVVDAFHRKQFKTCNPSEKLNLGKNPYPLWLHLKVKNISKIHQEYWWSFYTQADTIATFRKINNSYIPIDTIFKSTLLRDKKIRTRFPAFKVELKTLEVGEYLVKIVNLRNTQNALTDLTTPEDNLMWEKKFYWAIAFFMGCFTLIAIVSFFFGIFIQEKTFIFYSIYLFLIILLVLTEELFSGIIENRFLHFLVQHTHSLPNSIIALSLHFKIISFIFYPQHKKRGIKLVTILNTIFLSFGILFALIYLFFKEKLFFDVGIFSILWEISIVVIFSILAITLILIALKTKDKKHFILLFFLGIIIVYFNPAGYFLNYAGILSYYNITYPNYFYWIVCLEFIIMGCFISWRHQNILKNNYLLLSEKNKKKSKELLKKTSILEQERAQIARDLHDDLGATLSAIQLIVTNSYKNDTALVEMVYRANADVRAFFNKLNFNKPNDFNLLEFIQEKIKNLNSIGKTQFTFIFLGVDETINPILKLPIFKICNELLNNILKHSKATEATIQVIIEKHQIEILAEDNGIGYNTKRPKKGMGINNIQERVKKWQGNFYVSSNKNGTTSIITIPNEIKN